jgi:NADPH:quinone reductase-like Zn-dependent oxidoreductase
MKALQYESFGEPAQVLHVTDLPVPEPGPGEARLRVLRSPIHNHDLATIRGVYGIKPSLPATGGTEMLGVVDAVGPGVTLQTGVRVATMHRATWAEYAIVPAEGLVPVPPQIDDDSGAQLLAMPLSALVLFESLGASPGDWIVQNASNGAVGRIVMKLAQKAGVHVINLVRRQSAADELRGFGAEHVVISEEEGWANRVRAIAGDGKITRAIDSVCDAQSNAMHALLAAKGEHIIFGALGNNALRLDPGQLIFKESVVRGFWMTTWFAAASQSTRVETIGRLFALALAGEIPLPVSGRYGLDGVADAVRAAETPGRPGKVLFTA